VAEKNHHTRQASVIHKGGVGYLIDGYGERTLSEVSLKRIIIQMFIEMRMGETFPVLRISQFSILFLLLLPLVPSNASSGWRQEAGDLEVAGISIDTSYGTYRVSIELVNSGQSTLRKGSGILYDGMPGSSAGPRVVEEFPIKALDPGSSEMKEVDWEPKEAGFHRLVVVARTEDPLSERYNFNNIRSRDHYIPWMVELEISPDGNESQDHAGDFLAGVPLEVTLTARLPEAASIDMVDSVYMELGPLGRFSTRTGEGKFEARFQIKDLEAGNYPARANVVYSGMELPEARRTVVIREVPGWLKGTKIVFNRTYDSYVATSGLDVSTCSVPFSSDRLEGTFELDLFDGANEFSVRSLIQLDGTASVDLMGDVPISCGDDISAIGVEGMTFLSVYKGEKEMTLSSTGQVNLSFSGSAIPISDRITSVTHYNASLPAPLLLRGNLTYSGRMIVGGGSLTLEHAVSFQAHGCGSWLHSSTELGLDSPRLFISLDLNVSLSAVYSDGSWSHQSNITPDLHQTMRDLGLDLGDKYKTGDISGYDGDHMIASSGEDRSVGVSIKGGNKTRSSIDLYAEGETVTVWSSNYHKSTPRIALLSGGAPLLVWVESVSYSTDPGIRAASRKVRYSCGTPGNHDFSPPANLTYGGGSDYHPSISMSPDGNWAALVWVHDADGRQSTREDRDILFSRFEDGNWSVPHPISLIGVEDDLPTCCHSSGGDLWVSWRADGCMLETRVLDGADRTWGGISRSEPEDNGSRFSSPALTAKDKDVQLVYIERREGFGDRLMARKGDPARESLWKEAVPITETEERIEMPYPVPGRDDEGPIAVWRQPARGPTTYLASACYTPDEDPLWTLPIEWTTGSLPSPYPRMERAGNGTFRVPGMDPVTGELRFTSINLSASAVITDHEWGPKEGSGPGDLLWTVLRLKYTGLERSGKVALSTRVVLRDMEDGSLTYLLVDERAVEFTDLEQEKEVQVQHSAVQYEIGLLVEASPPDAVRGPLLNSRFISIPVLPDVRISPIVPEEAGPADGNLSLVVTLENRGSAPSGTRDLRVMSTGFYDPVSIEGGFLMPPTFRPTVTPEEIAVYEVQLESGGSASFRFNLSSCIGVADIWAELEPLPWEKRGAMSPPLRVYRRMGIDLEKGGEPLFVHEEGETDIELVFRRVVNEDLIRLDDRYWSHQVPVPVQVIGAGSDLLLSLVNENATVVWSDLHPISTSDCESVFNVSLTLPPIEHGDDLTFRADLGIRNGTPRPPLPVWSSEAVLLRERSPYVELVWSGDIRVVNGRYRTTDVTLTVNWSTINVPFLIGLYDGRAEDGYLISENLVLTSSTNHSCKVPLRLPEDDGYYMLTASVRTPSARGGTDELKVLFVGSKEMMIEDPPAEVHHDRERMDDERKVRTVATGIVSIGLVIAAGSALARLDRENGPDRGRR